MKRLNYERAETWLNYERAETINKDEIHIHLVMLIIKIITKLFLPRLSMESQVIMLVT